VSLSRTRLMALADGARRAVRLALILLGSNTVAYGLFHWLMGWPYGLGVLWACAALGLLVVGAGLLLSWPATAKLRLVNGVVLLVASVLLAGLWVTSPWEALIAVFAVGAFATGAACLLSFRSKRRRLASPTDGGTDP